MPGSLEQTSFLDSVAASMQEIGATTSTLNYTMLRWDVRWWSASAQLTNGTKMFLPTVGVYPYSGNTGLSGVTGEAWDAGTFALDPTTGAPVASSLNLTGVKEGSVVFYFNPPQTANTSEPNESIAGTGRNIPLSDIPELGNQTNAHVSSKALNFTKLEELKVAATIGAWTGLSDEEVALQWRPESSLKTNETQNVPSLFVGQSTGETLHELMTSGQVANLSVLLDAPSFDAPTYTLIAKLPGTGATNDSLLLYTHSDGPSCIEENGGFTILTMLEYFAAHPLSLNIEVVIETGHMASGLLNESAWMGQRPDIMENARAALMIEHLGAKQYKDVWENGVPVYQYTGKTEAIFTYANGSSKSDFIRQAYLQSYDDTPDYMRMPLITANVVDGKVIGHWPGLGGASTIGFSGIPTIGLEVQPDYLWAFMIDGGWSRFDGAQAVNQVETLIKTAFAVDQAWQNGTLYG